MKHRRFTLDEAESLLPKIREWMVEARDLKRRADTKVADWRASGISNPAEMAIVRGQVEFLLAEVGRRLESVTGLGCVPKDLEKGLVDFPSNLPGVGDVFLCWGFEDERIGYWHDLTEGFSMRKPLGPAFFSNPASRDL